MNEVTIIMDSRSQNESFARVAIAAFVAALDPTVAELTDIKTAVSEAVTNSVIHGYECGDGKIYLTCKISGNEISIEIKDTGIGIADVETAMAPLYTSKPEMERSGMGFTVMETMMDSVSVFSKPGEGTSVIMTKKLSRT